MRTLLFLAFMAGFATLGYIYAPRMIEDNYHPSDDVGNAAGRQADSEVAMASPSPMQATVKEITRDMPEAPKARVKIESKAKTKKHKAKKSKQSAAIPDHKSDDQAMDRVESKDVERVTGLRPLHGEVKNVVEAQTRPTALRQQEPLKSRWIDDLSGAKVRFNKKSMNDACADAYSNCERPDAPKDISVAGIVVKTQRLMRDPKRPLDGNVETGNYLDHTPAVYIE